VIWPHAAPEVETSSDQFDSGRQIGPTCGERSARRSFSFGKQTKGTRVSVRVDGQTGGPIILVKIAAGKPGLIVLEARFTSQLVHAEQQNNFCLMHYSSVVRRKHSPEKALVDVLSKPSTACVNVDGFHSPRIYTPLQF